MSNTLKKTQPPLLALKIRRNSFLEASPGYTEEQAVSEAQRCQSCRDKPCAHGCPLNVRIPDFIEEVARGNFEKAYTIIFQSDPMPAVCSRVCSSGPSCQAACVGPDGGGPVEIAALERFVADYHDRQAASYAPQKKKATARHKVAVIGSGPSGMSCAGALAKKGYDVTVFECEKTAGGVLKYAVPSFRLPENILLQSIRTLEKNGVKIVTNSLPCAPGRLISSGFEAVYAAARSGVPKRLNIPGEALVGIVAGQDFLARVNGIKTYRDAPIKKNDAVVVVGSGNMALDAARCVRRMGGRVTVLCRCKREDMTAGSDAVRRALEEDIAFKFLAEPIEFCGGDGRVTSVYCQELYQVYSVKTGQMRLITLYDSEFELKADHVVIAAGEGSGEFEECDPRCSTPDGVYPGCPGEEQAQGCFFFTGTASAIESVRAGKDAAEAIDQYIRKGACHAEYLHLDSDAAAPAAVSGLSQKSAAG